VIAFRTTPVLRCCFFVVFCYLSMFGTNCLFPHFLGPQYGRWEGVARQGGFRCDLLPYCVYTPCVLTPKEKRGGKKSFTRVPGLSQGHHTQLTTAGHNSNAKKPFREDVTRGGRPSCRAPGYVSRFPSGINQNTKAKRLVIVSHPGGDESAIFRNSVASRES